MKSPFATSTSANEKNSYTPPFHSALSPQIWAARCQVFSGLAWEPSPVVSFPFAKSTRSEEHTSELQSHSDLVCRLLLEKKKSGGSGLIVSFVERDEVISAVS